MKEDIDDIDEDIEDTEMDLDTLEAKIRAGSIFFCLKAVLWRIEDSLRKVFLQMGQKYQDCMIQWTIWELSCPKIRVSWFFSK